MQALARRGAYALLVVALSTQLLAATKAERIDALVQKYNALHQFNGAVLVADDSGVLLKKGYGYANFEWQIPNTPDTKFRIGSVTKQFTSMVIMQLVSEGKINLDEKITTYLPDYRKDTGDRVTVRHLLTHTSGIPSYTSQAGFFRDVSRNPFAVDDFVKKYASGGLEFEPGSKWVYNNSGYFLLGAIIEKVTGKKYADVLQERIFTPVGMKSSGYDLAATIIPKRANGYQVAGDGYTNAPYLDMSIPYAAGSLYSTVEDMYLWDRALYTDKLLSEDLKKVMYTPVLHDYAFGWHVEKPKLDDGSEIDTIGHTGGINGFNSIILRVPAKKEVVVLLDNTSRGDKLDPLALSILSVLHDVKPNDPKKSLVEALDPTVKSGKGADIIDKFRELRATNEYEFKERDLNNLGYRLLGQNRVDDAIEVFKLNVELFPKSGNVHDSLGEAYATKGQKELAIACYRKAFELDPKNTNAMNAIKRLEAPADTKQVPLEAFVGKYAISPTFVLSFFIEDGKLMTQATGQQKLGLRAESATEFAVMGVPARVSFELGADGKATSVTLHQGGRDVPAKRIE